MYNYTIKPKLNQAKLTNSLISKLIKNDNTKSGSAIKIYNPLKDITNAFNNKASASFSTDFSNALQKDIDYIYDYSKQISNGLSKTEAMKMSMKNASKGAQNFAEGIEIIDNKLQLTKDSFVNFKNDSRMAELSNLSLNTSLQNCASIINEYNGGFKNTKLSQEDFITAVGSSNHVLGNYLSGLNGSKATFGGYCKSLIGAKAATIGLQTASLALNAVIGMGIGLAITAAIKGLIGLVDKFTVSLDESRENLANLKQEFADNENELKSLNDELATAKDRINELQAMDSLSFTEKEELDNLQKQNAELQRQIDLLETEQKIKSKEKNKSFAETMQKETDHISLGEAIKNGIANYGNTGEPIVAYRTTQDIINQNFADYKNNLAKIAELDEQYKDDLANEAYQKERKRIEESNNEILSYLYEQNKQFRENSEGISYIPDPTTEDEKKVNEWLDYIGDYQDKIAILSEGTNAKQNAFERLTNNKFDKTTKELKELGEQGKVTADDLQSDKYKDFIQNLIDIGFISDSTVNSLNDVALAFNHLGDAAFQKVKPEIDLSKVFNWFTKNDKAIPKGGDALEEAKKEYQEWLSELDDSKKEIAYAIFLEDDGAIQSLEDYQKKFDEIVKDPDKMAIYANRIYDDMTLIEQGFKGAAEAKTAFEKAMDKVVEYDTNFNSYTDALNTLQEEYERGAVNSKTSKLASTYLLGEDFVKNHTADEIEEQIDKLMKFYGKHKNAEGELEDTFGFGFLEELNKLDLRDFETKIEKLSDGSYKFSIDPSEVEVLAKKLGITEEGAWACIEALQMTGEVELFNEDSFNDFINRTQKIGEQYKNLSGTLSNEQQYLDIDMLKKKFEEMGWNIEMVQSHLDNFENSGGVLVSFSGSIDDICSSLEQLGFNLDNIDLEELVSRLGALGRTDEEIYNIVDKLYSSNKTTLTFEGDTDDVQEQINILKDKADEASDSIRNSIQSALDGIEFTLDFSDLINGKITVDVDADTSPAEEKTEEYKESAEENVTSNVGANVEPAKNNLGMLLPILAAIGMGTTAHVTVDESNASSTLYNILDTLRNIAGNTWSAAVNVFTSIASSPVGNAIQGVANKIGSWLHGKASLNGKYGIHQSETDLIGEIAPELWVHSDTGTWELVDRPQFRKVRRGDVIFNGRQTEDLLKNGVINSFGNAYVNGKNGNAAKSASDKEDEPKIFDWIEIAIDRIEHAIDSLKATASSAYKALKTRLGATADETAKVNQEIALQEKAYSKYMRQTDSVGLSADLAAKVRNGTIDIGKYSSETQELIKDYQNWYEKAMDCSDAVQQLHKTLAELYEDKFDSIESDYDNQLSLLEHLTKAYEEGTDALETKGYLESTKYYAALKDAEKQNITILKQQLSDLKGAFSEAMNSGEIEMYSDTWYDMQISINDVSEAIAEANTNLLEYAKTMREIEWSYFDYIQDRIEQITQEADFLIDLMGDDNLYKENGQFNDKGMAAMGLHAQNYNVYMAQADQYAEEMKALNKEMAKDPYNTDLIERREELLKLQQKSISSAEDEKKAIADLVENGIETELDALKELIDIYTDSLDSAKDLYDYQKKIEEKTQNIASLQKQLSAYEKDTSEETKTKIQKLKVELEEAQEDLKETEYDKFVSDTKKLLDDLYNEYENIMNMRLDNIDALLSDMIDMVNANAGSINETLTAESDKVGYTLTEAMKNIWNSDNAAGSIVSKYGDNFTNQLTTVNQVLSAIQTNVAAMARVSNTEADKTIKNTTVSTKPSSTAASSSQNKNSSSKTTGSSNVKQVTVGSKINAKGAKIYTDSFGGGRQNQYYANDPVYTVIGENNGYWKVRYHKLSSGVSGWFKKGDIKAYKTGGLVDYTGLAQLDGTPTRPELVLNAADTKNFIALTKALREMSVLPNIGYDSIMKPTGSAAIASLLSAKSKAGNNGITFGNINIEIPIAHVDNYNDIVRQMQKDNQFVNMIQDMTVHQLTGTSALAKNRHRW